MKYIHHSNYKQEDEHYYAVVTYNVDDKKLVTISDLSLHEVKNNIVQENAIEELNCEAIGLAVDILILDKLLNPNTLLYNL